MSEEPKSPRSSKEKRKKQSSATVAVVNTPSAEPAAYSGEQHSFGRSGEGNPEKIHRRSSSVHKQNQDDPPVSDDVKPQGDKEFEFVSPRQHQKGGLRYDAIAVMVVMSFKVLVAPIILVAICVNSPYLQSPYVFRAASESFLGYEKMDAGVTYGCPDCGVSCELAVLQLAQFKHDPMMGKPAYGTLRTNSFEDYNSTLSAEVAALIAELESSSAVCGDGTSDWDESLTFISASANLIVKAVQVLGLPVSNDMIAEVTAAATGSCSARWTIEAKLKTFMFQPIPHINEFSSILAADLTIFPESFECRKVVAYDLDTKLTRAFVSEGLDQTRNAPTTLRLFPYNFPCVINVVGRTVAPVSDVESTDVVVQPMLRGYYGGCFVHLVNTSGIYIDEECEISSLWIDYGLMLQAPDDIPLCSTEGVCVHNYYNSQWEWVSTKAGPNIEMSYNTIRARYADKVEMSVLPGIVIMQILVMSMLSMYQVMSQKQSVLLSQIWAYRCQNGRMQAMYLLQIAYHLYRESDTYYLALGTGTMSVECVWNLTFCVMAFSYSFVNIVKSRTGEQQLDRHFRLSWEMVLLIVTAIVANMLISIRYTSLSYIFDLNARSLLRSSPEGATVCKLTDSCIVFRVNIAIVIAAFAMVVWGLTAIIAYVLRTRNDPHPIEDCKSWFISWKVAFEVTLRPPPKTKMAKALSHSASLVNLADATSFECYCIGEHFRFMFNDCEDISHVKKGHMRVPTAEAVLLSGFVYRGKYLYRADDIILLLFTRFAPNFILRTFNVLIVRWDVNPTTYAVSRPTTTLPVEVEVTITLFHTRLPFRIQESAAKRAHEAEAFASGTATRRNGLSSSRGGSRGSITSNIESKSSFLIAAVAENHAREIGICAIDLVSPYELLLWTVIDSHSYVDTMSLLQAYQPVEILVVETSKPRKINDEISKRFSGSNCRVVPIARKYFE
ncbi:hypothetical protein BBO99_00000037 [Phytophthora kernoviae]|uniref:Uncharacterized protein n=1 Tax=Phytophthora kernoviae TaxID=325452 RepID=A0A3R7H3R5_9STRA|nr:hypothetical protein BBI17_000037 [Phytophthora kernoviae]RLN85910.1 hypothetical protein BBO99_00000037 [Phytophthora kernoviae]